MESQSREVTYSCSEMGLQLVPQGFSQNTTRIILSHNKIADIKPSTFSGLASVVYLDISHNKLSKILPWTFAGLSNLETLNISSNKLTSTESFSNGVFKPLTSLKELDMRYNLDMRLGGDDYPDAVLADLTSLNILKLDCLNSKSIVFFVFAFVTSLCLTE